MTLFCDDYVREQGFETTEEYLSHCAKARKPMKFNHIDYYASLFQNKILQEGIIIKISNGNKKFECYEMTKYGSLVGIDSKDGDGQTGEFYAPDLLVENGIQKEWEIRKASKLEARLRSTR